MKNLNYDNKGCEVKLKSKRHKKKKIRKKGSKM